MKDAKDFARKRHFPETTYRPRGSFSAINPAARSNRRWENNLKYTEQSGISFKRLASVFMSVLMIRSRGLPAKREQLCAQRKKEKQ
jgi:hypothetical protein